MKKLRGKKRYYRNLMNVEISSWFNLQDPEKDWFSFYHQHIFNKDFANKSWKSRKQHLDALFYLFSKYEEKVKEMNRDFQLWININELDSEDDAIYLHTENPQDSDFPYKIDFFTDRISANTNLEEYLKEKDFKTLRFITLDGEQKESINYYLYRPNIGLVLF